MSDKMFIKVDESEYAKALAMLEKEYVSFTLESDKSFTFKDMGDFRKAILLFQDNKINFK